MPCDLKMIKAPSQGQSVNQLSQQPEELCPESTDVLAMS
jgi:hypothetical protein